MSERWYCKAFGQELGPMRLDDIKLLVERSDVLPTDLVKRGETGDWQPAGKEPFLFPDGMPSLDDSEADFDVDAAPAPGGQPSDHQLANETAPATEPESPGKQAEESPPPSSEPHEGSEAGSGAESTDGPVPDRSISKARVAPGRKTLLVGAVALSVAGAGTGLVARLLLGGSPPVAPADNNQAFVAQQREIVELTQQIEELRRHRDELNAQTADAPQTMEVVDAEGASEKDAKEAEAMRDDSAESPESDQRNGADSSSPPAGDKSNEPMPAEPAAEDAAPAAPPAPRDAAKAAGSLEPANPDAAKNDADAKTTSTRQRPEQPLKRLQLLRQISLRRQEMLAEFERLTKQGEKLAESIAATETNYAQVNAASLLAAAQLTQEEFNVNRNPVTIARLQKECAELGQQAAALQALRQQQAAEQEELLTRVKQANEQAEALRSSWLAIVDPFGQLDDGDQEAALDAFTEWTTLDADSPGSWLARGFAYWQLNRLDEALSDFNMAVKLAGPMLSNSLAARGGLLHAMQKPREAMADFGKALKFNKADNMVYLFRGRALCADEKFQSGAKDFKTAIQLNGKDAEAYRNLALVQAACPQSRFRNGKSAIENARQACELTEWKSWTAIDALAAACAEAGDFDEAQRWAEKAAGLSRGANQGQCLARLKQYQAQQPLRLDWKSLCGQTSAAANAPITK